MLQRLKKSFICADESKADTSVDGPTGCGKTQFVKKLLTQNVIEGTPERIVYCYGEYQSAFVELSAALSKISFVEGLPSDLETYLDPNYRS